MFPPELISAIGPPPDDQNEAAAYDARALRWATFYMAQGLISKHLYNAYRQGIGTLSTTTPPAMVMAAAQRITQSQEEMKRPTTGPELEEINGDEIDQKPLR